MYLCCPAPHILSVPLPTFNWGELCFRWSHCQVWEELLPQQERPSGFRRSSHPTSLQRELWQDIVYITSTPKTSLLRATRTLLMSILPVITILYINTKMYTPVCAC
ncbi:unnamed protein product [Boreogadus saida]